jgi:DNA-binding NtrC family response regulator
LRLYPLRERNEDIIALAHFFLGKHAAKLNRKLKFTPTALKELTRHNWPGNIRELENVVERILATLKGSRIDTKIVRVHLEDQFESEIHMQLRNAEIEDIRRALVLSRGKHAEAAKILGISRSTLWRRLKRMNV